MWNYLALVALLLLFAAAFAYINHFTLRLPRNTGLLVIALTVSIGFRAADEIGWHAAANLARNAVANVDFSALLLNGVLSLLLFAGATNVDVGAMLDRKATIIALATAGVALSSLLIAVGAWTVFHLVSLEIPFTYCLVFGALLSPTDPVTVTTVLRQVGVRPALRAVIEGESLFNDGIGIVLYTMFLGLALGTRTFDVVGFGVDFVREAGGGLLVGSAAGAVAFLAMRVIDDYEIELLISLALATGTYALALGIHVSGPVAVVVAGLIMGSVGSKYAVSDRTREHLTGFWETVDAVLNALLFMLIGLELIAIPLDRGQVVAAALMIPLAVLVRAVSVALPAVPLNLSAPRKLQAITLLTWSGLRGGISIALALSLPSSDYRPVLLTATYGVAIFTMVVQGLSLRWLAARLS